MPSWAPSWPELFNGLTGYGVAHRYQRLAVAPEGLRSRVLELIARTGGRPGRGRIVLKLNSLVDELVIDALTPRRPRAPAST